MKKGIIILKEDFCIEWLDILKKGGFDTLGLHFIVTENRLEDYLRWLDGQRDLIRVFEDAGITVEHEIHAVGDLMPRERFASEPEMFRMDESGKRSPDYNLCPSSSEALKCLEESAYRLAVRLGQKGHEYHIWTDDHEVRCHCEQCRGKSVSDLNLIVYHALLRGIKRYDPEAKIAYLAYGNAFAPPTLPIGPDVFLEFAPMNRNLQHRLTEPDGEKVRTELDRLLEVFPADSAQILEYWLDESLYSRYDRSNIRKLSVNREVFGYDMQYYADKGVGAIKTFGAYLDKKYLETYGAEEILIYGALLQQAEKKKGGCNESV